MSDPLAWIPEQLELLDSLERRRAIYTRATQQGPSVAWKDRTLINFSSNDYLNLAADPRLQAAACEAIAREGWGSGASPLITGRGHSQTELEAALAQFEGTAAALTFASGFAANAGVIDAVADRGDVILSDEKNHASIIDGTRLSKATVRVYPHRHLSYLENLLKQCGTFRRRLIVTDTLFSMDGDIAPLPELADLAAAYDAMLMVDEAHATGVFGANGRGLCEHFGIEDRVAIRVGTFSKALGGHGGFVVGSEPLIHWLVNRCRPYIFSTAPPAANAAAMRAALQIVHDEPERRTDLLAKATWLRAKLREIGWSLGDSESQIIPVIVGTENLAMTLSAKLYEQGMLVPGIRPPSVPDGECLLRISLSCGHTQQHLDTLVAAMTELRL
ncbi:8-amino-7-oxononanoate synthase [Blastopirellula marina]|uniref:8-amino-7-ketopelargonate synthase n=1 Tax=Blastopirellula marina TaxID=124 RepID=A0A2S8FNW2_9BACT|nr:8-amino-7-oxononanoate synthase [Blastopirellula marina]PQO33554.1 8-amino-7-oxononanoate synthase [Blastopirellula marina]PTL43341.1 8-amino-7-oxononanoate synthase [Blastopirellula marina]